MSKRDNAPAADDVRALTTIGLTKHQARCYAFLLGQTASFSAGELAQELKTSRTYLYPLLEDLRIKGFVEKWQIIGSAQYRAVPLQQALVAYTDYQRQQVRQLLVKEQHRTND